MRSLSVAAFIPDLISLIVLFFLACSVLPDEVGDSLDLADYYRDNRKRVWGLFALYTIWVTIVVGVRAELAGTLGRSLGSIVPNLALASLMLILIATPRRWVHILIISLLLVTTALAWLPQELERVT